MTKTYSLHVDQMVPSYMDRYFVLEGTCADKVVFMGTYSECVRWMSRHGA